MGDESSWPLARALAELRCLMLDEGVFFWCDVTDFTSLDEEFSTDMLLAAISKGFVLYYGQSGQESWGGPTRQQQYGC